MLTRESSCLWIDRVEPRLRPPASPSAEPWSCALAESLPSADQGDSSSPCSDSRRETSWYASSSLGLCRSCSASSAAMPAGADAAETEEAGESGSCCSSARCCWVALPEDLGRSRPERRLQDREEEPPKGKKGSGFLVHLPAGQHAGPPHLASLAACWARKAPGPTRCPAGPEGEEPVVASCEAAEARSVPPLSSAPLALRSGKSCRAKGALLPPLVVLTGAFHSDEGLACSGGARGTRHVSGGCLPARDSEGHRRPRPWPGPSQTRAAAGGPARRTC